MGTEDELGENHDHADIQYQALLMEGSGQASSKIFDSITATHDNEKVYEASGDEETSDDMNAADDDLGSGNFIDTAKDGEGINLKDYKDDGTFISMNGEEPDVGDYDYNQEGSGMEQVNNGPLALPLISGNNMDIETGPNRDRNMNKIFKIEDKEYEKEEFVRVTNDDDDASERTLMAELEQNGSLETNLEEREAADFGDKSPDEVSNRFDDWLQYVVSRPLSFFPESQSSSTESTVSSMLPETTVKSSSSLLPTPTSEKSTEGLLSEKTTVPTSTTSGATVVTTTTTPNSTAIPSTSFSPILPKTTQSSSLENNEEVNNSSEESLVDSVSRVDQLLDDTMIKNDFIKGENIHLQYIHLKCVK